MVTTNQKDRVQEAIKAYLVNSSQNELAQKCGVSAATLSYIRRGEYMINESPISDSQFLKLMEFFKLHETEGQQTLHWNTENFTRIQNVCIVAQRDKRRALLDGFSGAGKTYALEHFYRNNRQVIYQKCTSSMKKKDLLWEIMDKLKIQTDRKGDKAFMDAIRAKLTGQAGWLIIFDECEDVPSALYKAIKEIEDFTRGVCGLVVCGMDLERKLRRLAEKGKEGFPQLKRRLFANVVKLHAVDRRAIVAVLNEMAITDRNTVNWFVQNVEDYDMLNQYLSDCLSALNGDVSKITPETLTELFKSF